MDKLNLTQITTALFGLTYEEMITLNSDLVALIRHKQKVLAHKTTKDMDLKIGDQVSFDSKSHGHVSGKVEKINSKTVKVRVENVGIWNVSPQLLKKVG